MSRHTPSRVCVAVATLRRPATLAPLLEALAQLTFETAPPVIEFLLIDNDPAGSARATLEAKRPLFREPLHYSHVPEPGLCVVRNYALRFAVGNFDLLAMLDDDERPEPQWLDELLRVREATGADAVMGRIIAALPADSPAWITRGRFFDLPPLPDGAPVPEATTANCLVSTAAVQALELAFDPDMNEAGGEDQLFFRQLVARGGRIAFAAKAIVIDIIPAARLNVQYLLSRELRRGNSLTICDRKIEGSLQVLALRAVKGTARLAVGILSLPFRALRSGKSGMVTALVDVARGAGMMLGLAGVTIFEYRRARSHPDLTVPVLRV